MSSSLEALQREAGHVNELNGVVAFLVGALHEILRCENIDAAKTCAEMAIGSAEEYRAGHWTPGPHDDPANWRSR